jgi:plasmid stabilization system protein ParE
MTYKIIFSKKAEEDLIIEFYHSVFTNTAKKYFLETLKSVKRLSKYPESGRIVPELQMRIFLYTEN